MRRSRAGVSLIELLVSLLMTIVVAGGLFAAFKDTWDSRDFAVGQGTAETAARTPIDLLADHIRNAQQRHIGAGSTVADYEVLANATATSVTYYKSDTAGDTVQYSLQGTNLRRTADGSTTTVLSNVQSLSFKYWILNNPNGNYNNTDAELSATPLSSLTAAQRPLVAKIQIKANVSIDGYLREMASVVRLRNSPRKVRL